MSEIEETPNYVENSTWQRWRSETLNFGGNNPLKNFEFNSFGQIDLEKSHPGGFSQLVTGKRSLLSNLVRDPLAFSRASAAARRVKNKADRIESTLGFKTLNMVGGLATIAKPEGEVKIPILIWPISMLKKADDYEIEISGEVSVNPVLVQELNESFGIQLNESDLLARQNESSDFVPVTVLNYLANLTRNQGEIEFKRILVVGNFAIEPILLARKFSDEPHPVLSRLVQANSVELAKVETDHQETICEADLIQRRIISRALNGESFAVETLPGCGYLQTVVMSIAALAKQGKRVLLLAARSQTRAELSDRLSELGLSGLITRADSTWIDAVAAISRHEKAASESEYPVNLDSSIFGPYFEQLEKTHPDLGVSVAEAMSQIAKLTALENAPENTARIPLEKLSGLTDRDAVLTELAHAMQLGEFKFGPQDSAWFGAVFSNAEDVSRAIELAQKLNETVFTELSKVLADFTERVNFRPASTVSEWGDYLSLFIGVRETLDKFISEVFDRPLTELIAATAPRRGVPKDQRPAISGGNRRRLKKLAKEYLRSGMSVADMNQALQAIQQQRDSWRELSLVPTQPQVPQGILEAQTAYQAFVADLQALQRHLDPETHPVPLWDLPLDQLKQVLHSLANDKEVLVNLSERVMVQSRLADLGLQQLVRELARLHVDDLRTLELEFQLSWWQSALDFLITQPDAQRLIDFQKQNDLENSFAKNYSDSLNQNRLALAAALSKKWRNSLQAHPDEAQKLKQLLRSGSASISEIQESAPSLFDSISSGVLISPFSAELYSLPNFDVVFVLDAAGLATAEVVNGIRFAQQVIAFGDPAIAQPEKFELEQRAQQIENALHTDSAFAAISGCFGTETLERSYRTTPQALGDLINREFYSGRIQFTPAAEEYFGERRFSLEIVTAKNRANSTIEGATESLDSEVSRCVELVFNHALWHPEKSLLVASASAVHAERVRAAVALELNSKPNLAEFFDSHGREKFEVVSLSELTHRIADRVIFSIGFGRTSHGAVLSNFGQLNLDSGKRYLANLMVSAREQITVVSCFQAKDLPSDRLSRGANLLRQLLSAAEEFEPQQADPIDDQILNDLVMRLKKLGLRVASPYGELALVVSYGKRALFVALDNHLVGHDWIEKFAIEPSFIRALGWEYFRVFSFQLFSDPQGVANLIAEHLGVAVSKKKVALFDDFDRSFEDTDAAWGERATENRDEIMKRDKPPHWK